MAAPRKVHATVMNPMTNGALPTGWREVPALFFPLLVELELELEDVPEELEPEPPEVPEGAASEPADWEPEPPRPAPVPAPFFINYKLLVPVQ